MRARVIFDTRYGNTDKIAAALIVAVLLPIEIVVFTAYPLLSTVIGYMLFQSNWVDDLFLYYWNQGRRSYPSIDSTS